MTCTTLYAAVTFQVVVSWAGNEGKDIWVLAYTFPGNSDLGYMRGVETITQGFWNLATPLNDSKKLILPKKYMQEKISAQYHVFETYL